MKRIVLAYVVFAVSGVAGLGYQMAWTRALSLGLGHEMPSLLAIVSAFFGGLALGAWQLDRRIARSPAPHRIYAALELAIGVWGVVTALLLDEINALALDLQGPQPGSLRQFAVCFLVPFVALLPATTAMGATLAAMERTVVAIAGRSRVLAGVYAANTAGAVVGTLAGAYVLAPVLGYRTTLLALGAVNVTCALAALALGPLPAGGAPAAATATQGPTRLRSRILAVLLVTGLLGIGVELVAVRVLAQVFEATVYSFAAALAVYLLGTAAGAAIYQAAGARRPPASLDAPLLVGLAMACLASLWALAQAMEIYRAARLALGDTPGAVLLSEAAVAAAALGLPTLFMGAVFSHFAQQAQDTRGGTGIALSVNTLGAAVAPMLIGAGTLPIVGAHASLLFITGAYATLGLALAPTRQRRRLFLPALGVVLLGLPADLRIVTLRPHDAILDHREGVLAAVAVVASGAERNLRVDNRFQMGGTGPEALRLQRRQAHLPLLLHPAPRKALFLGVASGATVGAALAHPGLGIDAAEIIPEVLQVLALFEPENGAPHRSERVRLHAADARRFVRGIDRRYDVIVSDLFHPGRDGAGALYTVEHFRAVRSRLAPQGVFWQWLPLYQLDEDNLRLITRSFLAAFPNAVAFLADANPRFPALALVGTELPLRFARGSLTERMGDRGLAGALRAADLDSEARLLGNLLFDRPELAAYAGEGALNTDDRPLVIYRAPRFTALRGEPPHGRLLPLLARAQSMPADALIEGGCGTDAHAYCHRLRAYASARDRHVLAVIEHGAKGAEAAVPGYLASLRAHPEFTPSRNALLRIALARAATAPAAAGELVRSIVEARPDDMEARALLDRIESGSGPKR
jgi:spermidine synthase